MKCGSLFSGIAGVDLGFQRAGMETAWFCEFDKDARKVLTRHFPGVPIYEDVRTLDPGTLEPVDLISGGFPCQDISVAGRRAGLAGERSGLFHEFMRIADALSPRWLLIENVPGLLSSNDGRDMGTVLGTLGELGYGWAYRVLDAQYFGVAQRRRRVFIVGCLGDAGCAAEVLFEPESCGGDPPPSRPKGPSVAALTANGVGTCGADDNQAQAGHIVTTMRWREGKPGGGKGALLSEDRSLTLATANDQTVFHMTQEPITSEGFTPALGANAYIGFQEGMEVRRLTPAECERLQGFPDGWTEGQKDTTRYKQLGNAVCVNVAEWIGHRIHDAHLRLSGSELREEAE